MKNAIRLVALFVVSIAVSGCDDGVDYKEKDVTSKVRVEIERQVIADFDQDITIYAQRVDRNSNGENDELVFQCPCYIGENKVAFDSFFLKVEGDLFKLSLLPGAVYNMKVKRIG